jgi:5'(3')-deoxyribonucleotidase
LIITCDLDGVGYAFQKTYNYMMRTYRGIDMPHGTEWIDEWDAWDRYTKEEDRRWIWTEGVAQGLFRYGFMIKDFRWGLEELASDGHEFYIATARPANARQDTFDWCQLFLKDLPIRSIVVGATNKWEVARSDLLIDDNIDNVKNWRGNAILFDQPWNRSLALEPVAGFQLRIVRAKGWTGVVDTVRGKVESA